MRSFLSPRHVAIVAPLFLLPALAGCQSCKKQPKEEAKKDVAKKPPSVEEAPAPDGVVLEIDIRDPESVVKRGADGAGASLGPSPYEKLLELAKDESAQKIIRAIDPHGAMAGVMLYDFDKKNDPEFVGGVHLKDPEVAKAFFLAAEKSGGGFKATENKALGTTVYGDKEIGIAIFGDIVVAAKPSAALEKAGKYVAYRASKGEGIGHDLVLKSPGTKFAGKLQTLAKDAWAEGSKMGLSARVKAEATPVANSWIAALGELGDMELSMDVAGDELRADQTWGAKGGLAKFLAAWPAGDSTALLSMPKGDSAAIYRIPDGLGPLTYAALDDVVDGSTKKAADKTELQKAYRKLGAALGHDWSYVSKEAKGSAGAMGAGVLDTEILVRVDVSDAAAIKTSLTSLTKILTDGEKELKVKALAKAGADGQTVTFPSLKGALGGGLGGASPGGSEDALSWAVKDGFLYLDYAPGGTTGLLDAAVDPAKKDAYDSDAAARTKITGFPGKGIIAAGYGTSLGLGGFGALGALTGGAPSAKATAPFWSWVTVSGDGLKSKGALPLPWIADMTKTIMALSGGRAGMPGAMGMPPGAAPPSGVPF